MILIRLRGRHYRITSMTPLYYEIDTIGVTLHYFRESFLFFVSCFQGTLYGNKLYASMIAIGLHGCHYCITRLTPFVAYIDPIKPLDRFASHFFFLSVVSPLAVDNGVTPTGCKAARIIVIIVAYMREIVCLCTVAGL